MSSCGEPMNRTVAGSDVPMDQVGEVVMAAIINARQKVLMELRVDVEALRPGDDWLYALGWIDAIDAALALIDKAAAKP